MKIREVHFRNIRGLGASLRKVRFYDEETQLVRPLTVLVGSNGSGKTTALTVIEALLAAGGGSDVWGTIAAELTWGGYGALNVELGDSAPPELPKEMWFALGRHDMVPDDFQESANQLGSFFKYGGPGRSQVEQRFLNSTTQSIFSQWVQGMQQEPAKLRDGLLFFPHNRWIEHAQRGPIEPPPANKRWLFHFQPESGWQGSLSQLWLWQNYLDLEAGREGRKHLLSFVEPIEHILGRGRRVVIKAGVVRIAEPSGRSVALHELPSGEQQILTLFGEIIRQLRPGGVILIDEIEISLHPALQRAVIAHLRTLAREYDLQVVVTTHSMEIVKSVAPSEIVNLDDMVLAESQPGS